MRAQTLPSRAPLDAARRGLAHGATTALTAARRVGGRAGGRLAAGIRKVQEARMIAVLASLTEEQLAEIGVPRDGIHAHARKILSDDAGGR